MIRKTLLLLLIVFPASSLAFPQNNPPSTQNQTRARNYPEPAQGDFIIRDFKFDSGETLPELKLHYRTIGEPKRDAAGVV